MTTRPAPSPAKRSATPQELDQAVAALQAADARRAGAQARFSAAEAARATINGIANPTMPEVGERYLGTVVKTTTFGAFVSLLPGKDGLLHISQIRKLAGGKRVENVEDVLGVGQKVQVEIAEIDSRGKLSLIPVIEGEEGDADKADDKKDDADK